jgi:hypothetical protein
MGKLVELKAEMGERTGFKRFRIIMVSIFRPPTSC